MNDLYAQWKLSRFIDSDIKKKRDPAAVTWGVAQRLNAQVVVDEYAKTANMAPPDVADLLGQCIQNKFIGERREGDVSWIWVRNKKGRPFLKPSNFFLEEIKSLGPVWLFVTGVLSPILVWLLIHGA